ncbi:hypothetical protein [Aquibacillus rhizosphaerae]|uniref:Uncharacterized protein n=1 Tax=Aquibacillus rhizosphaerae TaxID=3051431 RepID=A0ABT7LA34_9BACI|nr:hypothetical protein [Aquibacillus sp. LR5S19]MDL4842254.1 hypothetical protein [Aquibacillus sp. LR5S19]
MSEPEFLLTYNASNYEWFFSIDEMIEFIEEHNLQSYEALHIPIADELELY